MVFAQQDEAGKNVVGRTRVAPFGVHLSTVDLLVDPSPAERESLSAAERDKAARFVFERDRRRYIAAHCGLRRILAARVGLPAQLLEFEESAFGKPRLRHSTCLFNLSHSGDLAWIAVTDDVDEIGVDVEHVRPMADATALAESLYTPAERRALAAASEAERDRMFLICWTRKEACLKAVGCGLSVEPATFEAGVTQEPRLVTMLVAGRTRRVHVQSCCPGDVVGAFARMQSE